MAPRPRQRSSFEREELPFSLARSLSGKLPASVSEIVDGILDGILKTILVFGALALITGIQFALGTSQTNASPWTARVLIASYVFAYGVVALVTLLPASTRNLKALTLLAALYFMGLLGLLESGLIGDGRLFFFGAIILAAVFYGFPAALWATLASVAGLAAVGWVSLNASLPLWGIFDVYGVGNDAPSWTAAAIIFLLLSSAAVVAVSYLKSVLIRSLDEADLARRKYQELYEQIPSMYFTLDPGHRIKSVNGFGAGILGYDPADLQGRNILDLVTGIDREGFQERLREAEGETDHVSQWEARLARKDGKELWVASVARGLSDGATLLVCRDITGAKELEQRLFQAQKMETVGQLVGGVAHDFNNLLVPIMGHAEMALHRLQPDDPLVDHLEHIVDASDQAADLSRQLLSFSRRQIADPQKLELNQLIEGFKRLIRRVIGEDMELLTDLEEGLWPILGGRAQVEQVLMNLTVNARDAMTEGGRLTFLTRNVEVDSERAAGLLGTGATGPHVMLAVVDTGTGMPADVQEAIFEPFFTTKAEGKGTGLGLATVFGILIQHGGSIAVHSQPGQGTRFEVFFPRFQGETEESSVKDEPETYSGNETVLVVEDEERVREVVSLSLTELGFTVLEAKLPSQGLAMAREYNGPIHLLLSDVILPEMDGAELWKEIRELRTETRVLFMSGDTRAASLVERDGGEEAPLLQKPFKVPALTRAVRDALDQ